jgi:hypothetical protein
LRQQQRLVFIAFDVKAALRIKRAHKQRIAKAAAVRDRTICRTHMNENFTSTSGLDTHR